MHILMTANASWNILHFRRPIVDALLADGHRVTVLAPADAGVRALEELGCRHIALEMDVKGLSFVRDIALIRRIRRHVRDLRPDITFGFTIKNNIYGALASRGLAAPFVPTVTGLGTAFLSGRLLRTVAETLYRVAFRRCPVVFFQNEDDRDMFLERGLVRPEQAHVTPGSGIDLVRFQPDCGARPRPAESASFLMIARLLRDKGVVEFAEAARSVRAQFPSVEFKLLGPLGAENRTAISPEMLTAWQEAGDLVYLGEAEDVRPYILDADCVVLPSYREGAPRTLIEAAAMGRPLIATDVPGCRSVVDDGRTGFLCASKSAPSLADACLRFLALNEAEKLAMGRAGRRKMEAEFDQVHVVSAYLNLLGALNDRER